MTFKMGWAYCGLLLFCFVLFFVVLLFFSFFFFWGGGGAGVCVVFFFNSLHKCMILHLKNNKQTRKQNKTKNNPLKSKES